MSNSADDIRPETLRALAEMVRLVAESHCQPLDGPLEITLCRGSVPQIPDEAVINALNETDVGYVERRSERSGVEVEHFCYDQIYG